MGLIRQINENETQIAIIVVDLPRYELDYVKKQDIGLITDQSHLARLGYLSIFESICDNKTLIKLL